MSKITREEAYESMKRIKEKNEFGIDIDNVIKFAKQLTPQSIQPRPITNKEVLKDLDTMYKNHAPYKPSTKEYEKLKQSFQAQASEIEKLKKENRTKFDVELVEDNYEYILKINGVARGVSKRCFNVFKQILGDE